MDELRRRLTWHAQSFRFLSGQSINQVWSIFVIPVLGSQSEPQQEVKVIFDYTSIKVEASLGYSRTCLKKEMFIKYKCMI